MEKGEGGGCETGIKLGVALLCSLHGLVESKVAFIIIINLLTHM